MKKKNLWLGIMAIVLVSAMGLVGCNTGGGGGGGGGSGDPLNGTWKGDDGTELALTNGSFVISENNKQVMKGKYTTTSAKIISATITLTITELHGDLLNEYVVPALKEEEVDITFTDKLYTKNQVIDVFRKYMKDNSFPDEMITEILADQSESFDAMFPIITGTIDGDTIALNDGSTYTKVASSSGTVPGTVPGTGGSGSLEGTTWVCTESYYGMSVTYTLTFTASTVKMESVMMDMIIDTQNGTYKVNGSKVTIDWEAGYEGSGSFTANGNKLTSSEGNVFIKQ